jgi:hypothetical protein
MSIAKIQTVQRSRKPGTCGKCGDELPVGSAYRHYTVGFRSHYKRVRCMKPTCTPRYSELESSRLADAYAAQETAEDSLVALRAEPSDDATEVDTTVHEFGEALEELASEYRSADEQFGGGGMTDSAERADELDSASQDLSGFSADEFDESAVDACETHDDPDEECIDCQELKAVALQEWWDSVLDAADAAVSEASF